MLDNKTSESSNNGGNIGKSTIEPSFTSQELSDNQEQETKYKLYGYRHFELAIYCLAVMCNQITWISLQPVAGAI